MSTKNPISKAAHQAVNKRAAEAIAAAALAATVTPVQEGPETVETQRALVAEFAALSSGEKVAAYHGGWSRTKLDSLQEAQRAEHTRKLAPTGDTPPKEALLESEVTALLPTLQEAVAAEHAEPVVMVEDVFSGLLVVPPAPPAPPASPVPSVEQGKPAGAGEEPLPAPPKEVKSPAAIRYHKLLDAALDYAERGWHVLPVGADKQPLIAGGVNSATKDPEKIAGWPKDLAGVAIACGPSDLLVVDIDSPEALERWKAYAGEDWKSQTAAIVRTARGAHLYFKGARKVPAHLAEDIDLKSSGGYVIAPPSVHATGHVYTWSSQGVPVPTPVPAPVPEWLRVKCIPVSVEWASQSTGALVDLVEGNRNVGITSLAGRFRRAGVSRAELLKILLKRNAALKRPLPEKEIREIVASAVRNYDEEETLAYTDTDNAKRLLAKYGDRLRFCKDQKYGSQWYSWDGWLWRNDIGLYAARALVGEVAADLKMWASQQEELNKRDRNKLYTKIGRLGQKAGIEGCLYAAEGPAVIFSKSFDTHPLLLNVLNGTLNLETGILQPPRKEDLLSKQCSVRYEPDATCPRWEAFLEEVLPDKDLRDFVQMAIGYSLSGKDTEHCFFFLYGTGANGKTTLVETLLWVLGDYAMKASPDLLLPKKQRGATPEVAELIGRRVVVASETGRGQAIPEARIKNMTGGDTQSGRALYQESQKFTASYKIWIFGNHKLAIRGTDEGIWRRVRLIPFTVQIPKEKRNLELPKVLQTEGEGILAWAVRGFQLQQEAGTLPIPEGMQKAIEVYKEEEDIVGDWFHEVAERVEGAKAYTADLKESWSQYVFTTFEAPERKEWSWKAHVPDWFEKNDYPTTVGKRRGRLNVRLLLPEGQQNDGSFLFRFG